MIQMGNCRVHSVYSRSVLTKVVGADAEEINLLRKDMCRYGSSRDLDHHAHFDVLVEGMALFPQFSLRFFKKRLGIPQFFQGTDHREHDFDFPKTARPQNRSSAAS